jgi:membrane protein DedA with SNARE-associated domain
VTEIAALIYSLFARYGYGALFVGVMLEAVGFPIPGELVLLFTGSMVASQEFSMGPAVIIAASGALLSDSGWYFAGRFGSKRLISLYCRVSFGSTACLARTERNLARFGPRSLIYARFIPGFRTFAAPMAGMSGVPFRLFALYDGIGALLWATLGIWTGAVLADELVPIVGRFKDTHLIFVLLAAMGLLMFILVKWFVRLRHGRAEIVVKSDAAPAPSRQEAV